MTQGNYANVNGLKMYYETYGGSGEPLILLHGGLGGIGMFAEACRVRRSCTTQRRLAA